MERRKEGRKEEKKEGKKERERKTEKKSEPVTLSSSAKYDSGLLFSNNILCIIPAQNSHI
jgi:hypothetical protein